MRSVAIIVINPFYNKFLRIEPYVQKICADESAVVHIDQYLLVLQVDPGHKTSGDFYLNE